MDELTRLLQGKVDNYGSCHNDANADEELRKMGHYEEVGKNHNAWNTKVSGHFSPSPRSRKRLDADPSLYRLR